MDDTSVPWEAAFDRAPVPLSVIDTTGRFVAWNRACADLLGYAVDDIDKVDVGRITRPRDQAWTRGYLMRLLSGEIDRFDTDKVYVRRDGSEVPSRLSCRAITDADGHCTHIVAVNVALPADAPNVPAGAAERLLEFGEETVSLVDVDGTIRLTKGTRTRTQGYPTRYWRDRSVRDLLAPGEWERVLGFREEILAAPGATVSFEVEMVTGHREHRTIATEVSNCLDDPVLAGLVVVTRDVTEERTAITELARRRRSAEAVGDARTRLLATVSHELRNPLHAVHGLAELLTNEELPPSAAELAASLLRQISGLTRVTDDLLDAARLDAGTTSIEAVPTDLVAIVHDVVELGRAGVGDKPVTVSSRIAPGVPSWVLADPDRLRQVLGNLVGNAVKFTERGSVQLAVRPDGPASIAFSVIDSGVGIPSAEQSGILEPFAVGSTAGVARGAGLGLSIVQRLVSAMDGRLTLTSTVGEGSRFDVSLPLPARDAPEPTRQETSGLQGVRVLAVEDNPVNQQLVQRQLERLEIEAVVVGTGEAGIERLTGDGPHAFDVVLMDHQLPGWSGVETTERIRALDGPLGDIPIIGVSAATAPADRERFIAAGMDELVTKPATINDLAAAISSVLADRIDRAGTRSPGAVPDATSDHQQPAVDRDVLDQLVGELGDADVVAQLVRVFLDELDGRVATIAGDDETASRRGAHTVASSALLLGAITLGHTCRAIEDGTAEPASVHEPAAAARAGLLDWLYDRGR